MVWKVEYYHASRGTYPVKEFLILQDRKVQLKVQSAIQILVQYGPYLKPPYMKKLAPNLYELRIKSQIAIRIFYSLKSNTYILLHAFKKKTQKTPDKELRIALDRMKEII